MHSGTLRLWFKEHNLKEQTETDYKKPSEQTMALAQINTVYCMYAKSIA